MSKLILLAILLQWLSVDLFNTHGFTVATRLFGVAALWVAIYAGYERGRESVEAAREEPA